MLQVITGNMVMEIDKFFLAVGTNTAFGDSHRPCPVRPKTIAQCNRPRPVRSKPSPSVIALAQFALFAQNDIAQCNRPRPVKPGLRPEPVLILPTNPRSDSPSEQRPVEGSAHSSAGAVFYLPAWDK